MLGGGHDSLVRLRAQFPVVSHSQASPWFSIGFLFYCFYELICLCAFMLLHSSSHATVLMWRQEKNLVELGLSLLR